jgi:hypothetical protein
MENEDEYFDVRYCALKLCPLCAYQVAKQKSSGNEEK